MKPIELPKIKPNTPLGAPHAGISSKQLPSRTDINPVKTDMNSKERKEYLDRITLDNRSNDEATEMTLNAFMEGLKQLKNFFVKK